MPAQETTLLVLFWVLLGIAILGGIGATLGKPLVLRVWRYFKHWWERDRLAEQEAKRQAECRRLAEKELKMACGDDIAATPETADLPRNSSTPQTPEERLATLQQGRK